MMNKQQILKRIGQIIDDLKEQHIYLSASEDFDVLEMELFAANSDFLIDHIAILKKLQTPITAQPQEEIISTHSTTENNLTKDPQLQEISSTNSFISPIEETNNFQHQNSAADMMFEFEQNVEVEQIFDRKLTPEETKVLQEKQVAFSKLNDVNQSSKIKTVLEDDLNVYEPTPYILDVSNSPELINRAPLILEDKIEEEITKENIISVVQEKVSPSYVTEEKKQTLNDSLSNQKNVQSISSRLSNMATQDLKSSISLNDKMIFIKELFNGYNLAYSEAIEILNRFDSFEAADNFLQKNYAVKNKWLDKQAVVDRFYELLNRRYIK